MAAATSVWRIKGDPVRWCVPSASHPGDGHLLIETPALDLECDCLAFRYRSDCRHRRAVLAETVRRYRWRAA